MENKEKTYMVVDLKDGSISYLSDVPAGGWTDEYKTEKLVLRYIPSGTFMMGSPEDELGRNKYEQQHEVTLTKPFYIGVFEVTQKQYELITGSNPSEFKGDTRPIESIDYDTIQGLTNNEDENDKNKINHNSFFRILQSKVNISDIQFDLPTEAQWEYACRAGSTSALNNGNNLSDEKRDGNLDKLGWYYCNSGEQNSNNYLNNRKTCSTYPVGQKLPNSWGLYDMHGNVWEWCLDSYDCFYEYDDDVVDYAIDPVCLDEGRFRVLRGGCCNSEASQCRSAERKKGYRSCVPENPVSGFRVVLNQQTKSEMKIHKSVDATEISKLKPKYLVLDLETYKIREEEKGPKEDPNILNDDNCRTKELWLRRIEQGSFIMGSPEGEQGRKIDEKEHRVILTKSFYIGVFTITQWQYVKVTGDEEFKHDFMSHLGDTRPFDMGSYSTIRGKNNNNIDENSFLGILRSQSHLNFDLPTEAEWEYACRANTSTPWNNGMDYDERPILKHYSDNSPYIVKGDLQLDKLGRYKRNCTDGKGGGYKEHTKVGSYQPNAWGLYDMHGNVCELCLDMYSRNILCHNINPLMEYGENHVCRGGDYSHEFGDCRSAKRHIAYPGWNVGFRVVLKRNKIFLSYKDSEDSKEKEEF